MAFLALACLPVSMAWSLAGDAQPASLPVVELSLAAPDKPLPVVSAVIGDLDASREKFEAVMMNRVQEAARLAASSTTSKIDAVISRFEQAVLEPKSLRAKAGFLQKSSRSPPSLSSFLVHVKTGSPAPEDFAKPRIQSIEAARQAAEEEMFAEAIAQFATLGDRFAEELEAQLERSGASFLRPVEGVAFLDSASRGNVRVASADAAYPTIGLLAEAMQRRRSSTELLAREKIELMQIEVLQAANLAAKAALSSAARRIGAKTAPSSLRSVGSTRDASQGDFEVVLNPPEEKTSDVKASLDLIMKGEDLKREADEAEFAREKQDMVNAEKDKIRSLVDLS